MRLSAGFYNILWKFQRDEDFGAKVSGSFVTLAAGMKTNFRNFVLLTLLINHSMKIFVLINGFNNSFVSDSPNESCWL